MIIFDRAFSDRIIQGDSAAVDELYRHFYKRLLSFAMSYLHDEEEAENIVQDAFVMLWERHDTLRPDSNVQAWLLTVAKNRILNHLDRMKRRAEAEQAYSEQIMRDVELSIMSLSACEPEQMFGEEAKNLVDAALADLSEQTRQIIVLSRYENLSNKEIAERLDISVKGVEYHITQALKTLRLYLKDYMPIFLILFG
ncbi:MAG: RNA polymerase sigma-70 factor [Tannerella sp.]|jgi:RNA polymerase sigma-70 factor (ECF subfamily)|nr:RNA polymerase sigma-70 factor [Tannerella sp.]